MADPKSRPRSGGNGRVRRLVIVESPTKARKIAGYLGSNYIVESSRGHIRDLPRAAADVPAKYKSEPWARLGVNVDADFEPLYIISPEKKSTVTELKGLLKDVDELYLATDGDREGEAIAWHLLETLKPRIPVKRMVFHEITEPAILRGRRAPPRPGHRPGRRAGDPPHPGPAVRLRGQPGAVEEGRARSCRRAGCSRWPPASSCSANATGWRSAAPPTGTSSPSWTPACPTRTRSRPRFTARLTNVDGQRVATGRDFDSLGALRKPDEVVVLDEAAATALATGLHGAQPEPWPRWRRSPTPAGRTRPS